MQFGSVVLSLFIVSASCAQPQEVPVLNLVYVTNSKGQGSGFVVGDELVATAAHMIPKGKKGKVQVYPFPTPFNKKNESAKVLYINRERDIAILHVPWARGTPTLATTQPLMGVEVIQCGYTTGSLYCFRGHIVRSEDGLLETDISASFGASGSAVYDAQTGRIVGMVSYLKPLGAVGAPTVIGLVPSTVLAAVLEGYGVIWFAPSDGA